MIDILYSIQKQVEEGELEALKAYAQLKQIETSLKEIIGVVYDLAIQDTDKYGTKKFKDFGYSFEVRNGRATYKYDHLNDWNEAKRFTKELEERAKDALKLSEKGQTLVDDNGEVVPSARVEYSKDSIIVKPI